MIGSLCVRFVDLLWCSSQLEKILLNIMLIDVVMNGIIVKKLIFSQFMWCLVVRQVGNQVRKNMSVELLVNWLRQMFVSWCFFISWLIIDQLNLVCVGLLFLLLFLCVLCMRLLFVLIQVSFVEFVFGWLCGLWQNFYQIRLNMMLIVLIIQNSECQLNVFINVNSIGLKNVRLMYLLMVQVLVVIVCLFCGNYVVMMWLLVGKYGVFVMLRLSWYVSNVVMFGMKFCRNVYSDYSVIDQQQVILLLKWLRNRLLGICIVMYVYENVENMMFIMVVLMLSFLVSCGVVMFSMVWLRQLIIVLIVSSVRILQCVDVCWIVLVVCVGVVFVWVVCCMVVFCFFFCVCKGVSV